MAHTVDTRLLERVLQTSYHDPDLKRRARTLNILLLAAFLVAILAILSTLGFQVTGIYSLTETQLIYVPSGLLALSIGIIYLLNRRHHAIASTIFLVLLVILLSMSDDPQQIAYGRGQLFLALPVIMASIVLPAWTSFVFAGLVSLVVNGLGLWIGTFPLTPFSTFAYMLVALVSFLGASQLERALSALRIVNRELDQRVEARTKELNLANERLTQANKTLRELDRLKSQFLSMVSHELRTPLNAIQGFAEILLAEVYGPINEQQRHALQRIVHNTGRLLQLVSDLLDQARIEAGQLTLRVRPFSPIALVDDVAATMRVIAETKGLDLTAVISPSLPRTLYGDENRLRQILVNLTGNAIKYTDSGSVSINLSGIENNKGTQQAYWEMTVSDTGPGIPEDYQDIIFDPFQRMDDASVSEHLGVGLGLAIVKEIVQLMNGTIELDSEIGKGSSFRIRLPLEQEEQTNTSGDDAP